MLAVKEGRDDLAKQALMRQGEHFSHGQQLEQTWSSTASRRRSSRIAARSERQDRRSQAQEESLGRAPATRAGAKRIAETMSSMSEKSAFEAFARMEERIETNERQLKASIEIEEEFTGDRLAQDFKQLEKGAVAGTVDVQLMALKQKMGMLPAGSNDKRALGAGRIDEEDCPAEIEENPARRRPIDS